MSDSRDNDSLEQLLTRMGQGVRQIAPLLPGHGAHAARVAGVAIDYAAALARAGLDPIQEIERIRRTSELTGVVEEKWSDELDRVFGPPDTARRDESE
ncbi:MAG: hypothetical protein AAGA56_14670 [Myxococcota bacterium]